MSLSTSSAPWKNRPSWFPVARCWATIAPHLAPSKGATSRAAARPAVLQMAAARDACEQAAADLSRGQAGPAICGAFRSMTTTVSEQCWWATWCLTVWWPATTRASGA